ncbi:MAG TPA: hypothetical protein DDW86_06690 [Clostridiales bacterium]|nr:hypothetical protein [Clostridiales bacterium]
MKKLAIIGCGGIGGYHLSHFLGFSDIELAGFCDLIPQRAESFVKQANSGKAFTDFREMYDAVEPDMVFICVPPTCHGDIEMETIRRRIPFFVEKPLSLDLELARQIRDEVKKAGLITASGFQCRYSNLVKPNVKFIKDNEVAFIDCIRIGGVPETPWWKEKSLSGGQIVEQTIHQFDIIRYVFDEPEMVFTLGTRGFVKGIDGYDTDDLSTTVVRFHSGALATISTGCYAKSGEAADSKVVFSAKDGRAELRILNDLKLFGCRDSSGDSAKEDKGSKELVVQGDGTMTSSGSGGIVFKQEGDAGILCDRTFIDAAITGDGSRIRSPYEDALRSLEFTLACNQSMETGLPVKIENK